MAIHVYFGKNSDGIFMHDTQSEQETPGTPIIDGQPVPGTRHIQLWHHGERVFVYWREADIRDATIGLLADAFFQYAEERRS